MAEPREGKTHHIVLKDGSKSYGIILDNDVRSIDEDVTEPFNLILDPQSTRFGDFDPKHAHLEQRDWSEGGQHDFYFSNDKKFYESGFMWSMTPEMLVPAPLWKYAPYYGEMLADRPGASADITWKKLVSDTTYLRKSTSITSGDPDIYFRTVRMWIRRIGEPGTLTVKLENTTKSKTATATLTSADFGSDIAQLQSFTVDLTAITEDGNALYLSIYSDGNDRIGSHWEVACHEFTSGGGGEKSANGSSWTSVSYAPFFEMTDITYHACDYLTFFNYLGCLYFGYSCTQNDSAVYMVGDRGKATAATANTISDTGKAWKVNVWSADGAKVKIISGKGMGQSRTIASNTATALTVTTNFDVTPDTTSNYVIYDTGHITLVNLTYPDYPISSIHVGNAQVFICYNNSAYLQQFKYDLTTGAHSIRADGTNYAKFVLMANHSTEGMQLYRIVEGTTSSTWTRSDLKSYGSDHVFDTPATAAQIDGKPSLVTALVKHLTTIYIMKEDGAFYIDGDVTKPVNIGLDAFVTPWNGAGAVSVGDYMYFPWGFSMERLYGNVLDDIGLWRDAGVPADRSGRIAKIVSVLGWFFVLTTPNSTTAHAAVWVYTTLGWHEIWRSPMAGQIASDLFWQENSLSRPRLWIALADELVYIEFPFDTLHPLRDSTLCYVPESNVTCSTMDFGKASLTKILSSITVVADGLSQDGNVIEVDYQTDEDVGTDTWKKLGTVTQPYVELPLKLGNRTAIRIRARVLVSLLKTAVKIKAIILGGVVRLPFSKVWTITGRIATKQLNALGVPDAPADEVMEWLYEKARESKALQMYSDLSSLNRKQVIVLPPKPYRVFANKLMRMWGGKIRVTFREV